jgi:GNAT superfamily N-acetyltransferase
LTIKIVDVNEGNIDDLIFVCSSKYLSDPKYAKGIELKRKWLLKTMKKVGVCAKIAYFDDRPVGQILFQPEDLDPSDPNPRKGVLYLHCIYVPFPEVQKKGVATALLNSLIEDCMRRPEKLGMKECKFIVTHAFDTGTFLSQGDFFRRKGFKNCPDGGPNDLYFPILGEYEPKQRVEYTPLEEDLNRAVIIFGTACQFGHVFATRAFELIKEVAPDLPIALINKDEQPEESKKRAGEWLIVNARPIRAWVGDTETFKNEVMKAIKGIN